MDWILEEFLEFALLLGAIALLLTIRGRWRPWTEGRAIIRGPVASLWPVGFGEQSAGPWSRRHNASVEGWPQKMRAEAARRQLDERTVAVVALDIDGLDDQSDDMRGRIRRAAAASIRGVASDAVLVHDDDRGRFRVLLADADEDSARAYVDLVSRPLARWLEDPRSSVRLTAGWAATSGHRDLEATDRLAEARLVGASAGWIRSASTWRSAPPSV